MKSLKIRQYVFFALYIALVIFAIVQSTLTAEKSSSASEVFTSFTTSAIYGEEVTHVAVLDNTLSLQEFANFLRKVIGHFTLFGMMGLCGFFALYKWERTNKAVLIDLLATFSVASLTEVIQCFVPSRVGNFSDIVLDTQGAIVAIAIVLAIISISARLKNGKKRKRLWYYLAVPTLVFSVLFIVFNADNLYSYFCFALYFALCAISIVVIFATNEF